MITSYGARVYAIKKKKKKVGKSKFYKLAMWASPNFILLNLCDILIIGKIAINSWF